MTQDVYEFKVVGNEDVIKAYEQQAKAADHTSKVVQQGSKTTSDKARDLSRDFKGLAGDVGVFGNAASESFSRAASDATGLVEVFTSGSPLMIGIAAATVAVGFLAKAWVDSEEAAGKALDTAFARITKQRDDVTALANKIMEGNKAVTKEDVAMQKARADAAEILQAKLILGEEKYQSDLAALRKRAAASFSLDPDKDVRAFIQAREDELKVAKEAGTERRRANEMQAKLDASDKKKADEEAAVKSAAERKAESARRKADKARQADAEEEEDTRRLLASAKFLSGMREQAERDGAERAKNSAAAQAKDDAEFERDMAEAEKNKASADAAQALADAKIAASKAAADAEIADLERVRKEQEAFEQQQMALAVSQYTSTAAMAAMAPALDLITGKMSALRDVNRETAGDFLKMADDAPQAAMKYAQGILTGIAMQATGEAALEAAKAVGDVAGSVTAFAYGNVATGTALMESAGMHAAAAAGYAAIAGGGAGAAFAIGAVRPPTNDEKRTQAQRQDGGGSVGGPSAGSTSGAASGNASVNVSIIYGAGSIAPQDERRSATVVNNIQRRARRDGFMQLESGA